MAQQDACHGTFSRSAGLPKGNDTVPFTRRRVLAGATATGVAAVAAGSPALLPSAAATSAVSPRTSSGQALQAELAAATPYLPAVRPYRDTRFADAATRHMTSRFAYGYTPQLRREVRAAGGPQAWFEQQLRPGSIPDTTADAIASWFPTRTLSAAEHFQQANSTTGHFALTTGNHARWTLLRRTYSNRQLHEVLSEFWLNHFHVHGLADLTWLWRTDYDNVIRGHALGRFDEMLQAAIVHPCMLTYLDADLSIISRRTTGSGVVIETDQVNENLGRELLELHTVGGGGTTYGEADVRSSAYILTGYRIDRFDSWADSYDPSAHFTGPVRALDFTDANTDRDGRAVLSRYLRYLAHHPATAQRIARKLAVRFVSDNPSSGLVDQLAQVFTRSGTDIKETLRALVSHPDFEASAGKKVRTPSEDLVATLRVYGVDITRPQREADAANAIYYLSKNLGQAPFGWERPDGFPDSGSAWSSAARMMGSFHIHYALAAGFYPSTGVNYRPKASWLPEQRIRFDQFVDHLCRTLHGRPSTRLILGAACIATDMRPGDIITRDHVLINYRMPRLLGILLDTPAHMTR